MGILYDRSRRAWVLKLKVAGKDKRFTLRKFHDGELSEPLPMDVAAMASEITAKFQPQTRTSTPLVDFVAEYQSEYRKHRRPNSCVQLGHLCKPFLAFAHEQHVVSLHMIDADYIKRYFEWRVANSNRKPQTVVADLKILSGLFSEAKRRKLIVDNPVTEAVRYLSQAYPAAEPALKFLEPQEIKKFIAAVQHDRRVGKLDNDYADLALLMVYTGIRVSACINLQSSWVNMSSWTICIPAEHDKVKTGYSCVVAAGGRAMLRERMKRCGVDGRLFPSSMSVGCSYHRLRLLAERHGINFQGGSFNHALRHSVATSLVDAGVPIQVISSQLGHHDIKTTQRYARVRDQAKSLAMDKLTY